jgi:hypothetical protein
MAPRAPEALRLPPGAGQHPALPALARREAASSTGVTMPRTPGLLAASLAVLGTGCTTNRPVQLSPELEGLATFLQTSRPSALEVTDTGGKVVWLHAPAMAGDSLAGVLNRGDSRTRQAFAPAEIRTIAEPHFSAGRTLGLVGGVLGSMGIALLVVAPPGSEPVY